MTTKSLREILAATEKLISEALGIISAAPKTTPSMDMEQRADAYLAVLKTKEVFREAEKQVNKVIGVIAEDLCRFMVDRELTEYDFEGEDGRFRLYPDARGYFNAPHFARPDFPAFWAWVQRHPELLEAAAEHGPKRALNAFCDGLLERGEDLPPQVRSWIKATVKVRRLRSNG